MARFCTYYNVETQHEEMLDLIKQMHRERERKNRLAIGKVKKASEVQDGLKELDPEQLGKLRNFWLGRICLI